MATNDTNAALANELGAAIDELQIALRGASDAATRIKTLIPRITAVNALLDEIESVIHSGRQETGGGAAQTGAFARPTLVVPGSEAQRSIAPAAAEPALPPMRGQEADEEPITRAEPQTPPAADLICFRLEFQSNGGPLDLRAVDDAVGEHPAVRDVALLDYDGRRATLKVWIIADASPSDVQESLRNRAAELFSEADDVTIVALEDAA